MDKIRNIHQIDDQIINISFKNNGLYTTAAINRPILQINNEDDPYSSKVIGVITDVNEELVHGKMYAAVLPELYNDYVCSVELKTK